jgi:hypothetical protein
MIHRSQGRFEYIPSNTTDHVLPESLDDSHN